MNTDKNDPNTDPTNLGNSNYCHSVRMFQLTSSNNYVFRVSNKFGPLLTKIMLQGNEMPELEGDPMMHEIKRHLPDCLFKRIVFRPAKKFGYYLPKEDFAEFVAALRDYPTRVRVVVFSKTNTAGHVEMSPVEDDFPRDRDVKGAESLRKIDAVFTQEYRRKKIKEAEKAAATAGTEFTGTEEIPPAQFDIPIIKMQGFEIQMPTAKDSVYAIQAAPGVDLQYMLLDPYAHPGVFPEGEGTYTQRRSHLPDTCLLKRVAYIPPGQGGTSTYVMSLRDLMELTSNLLTRYPEVTLTIDKLDGTKWLAVDAEEVDADDRIYIKGLNQPKYDKYLIERAEHREKTSSVKPVA